MVSKFGLNVRVENVAAVQKNKTVYFDRTVQSDNDEVDVNIILSAMQMLFPGSNFRIIVSTYGG